MLKTGDPVLAAVKRQRLVWALSNRVASAKPRSRKYSGAILGRSSLRTIGANRSNVLYYSSAAALAKSPTSSLSVIDFYETLAKASSIGSVEGPGALGTTVGKDSSTLDAELDELDELSEGDPQFDSRFQEHLKPPQIVQELNKYIIGQAEAKKAVAIALRNRWRRLKLNDELREEIQPKNILMVGPTGCGKTEIARRLASLAEAPFLKVEATKFTEVGFHGRDVDRIISDLVEVSINLTRKMKADQMKRRVQLLAEREILNGLAGPKTNKQTRECFREILRKGELENQQVEVSVPVEKGYGGGNTVFQLPLDPSQGMGAVNQIMQNLGKALGSQKREKRKMKVAEARPILEEAELERLLDSGDITKEAIANAEERGIVFIDEIDKICNVREYNYGADASSEGVQRDLLPLIEGCIINTKYGNVNTHHMLFIASGAFHACSPSDLLPELQGRLPIRVELQALKEEDLVRILTEPRVNLIKQQEELLRTEGLELAATDDAVKEMARVAAAVNRSVENIGARRLHTIVEKIVDTISFEAATIAAKGAAARDEIGDIVEDANLLQFSIKESTPVITITKEYVEKKLEGLLQKQNLERFIL